MIYGVKLTNGNRQEVADYIRMKKSQGKFRVVDVGGVFGGWSMPFIDAIIVFNVYSWICPSRGINPLYSVCFIHRGF